MKPKENCLHVFNREQIICQRLIPTYSGSREQGHYKNNPSSIDNPKTKMNFYPSKNFIQKLKRKISSRPTTLFATSVSGLPQTLYEIFPPLLHTFVTVLTGQVNDTTFSPNKIYYDRHCLHPIAYEFGQSGSGGLEFSKVVEEVGALLSAVKFTVDIWK